LNNIQVLALHVKDENLVTCLVVTT